MLCPGSRNAPLAFASYDAAEAGRITLHTRIDERTAGFLALGLAKGSRRPAVVVCTSGTAAANLHPAVLEAAHAGVPLVVVTADRPARLRGTGANQTTDQVGLFGDAQLADARRRPSADDLAARGRAATGPVHLNVQFDEPLVPERPVPRPWIAAAALGDAREAAGYPWRRYRRRRHRTSPLGPRTVVVAGDDAGPPARPLAEKAGWPLLAEPSSGSRTGDSAIRTYRLLLGGRPRRAGSSGSSSSGTRRSPAR